MANADCAPVIPENLGFLIRPDLGENEPLRTTQFNVWPDPWENLGIPSICTDDLENLMIPGLDCLPVQTSEAFLRGMDDVKFDVLDELKKRVEGCSRG